jgi:hypothetical protein
LFVGKPAVGGDELPLVKIGGRQEVVLAVQRATC